ncbi:MAG TPA: hypothetical protein VNW15_10545 [Rhizomicrobium sp.]|nr:hypothetical protein [Rhizomicrobium sp.]
MNRAAALLFACLAWAGASQAQPAPKDDPALETVIVTAPRLRAGVTPNAIAHDFIRSIAMPSVLLGEIPRWRRAVCPRTDGLSRAEYTSFVTERIRTVAVMAGVPVAPTPCKPNIQIFFTAEPQTALNVIHAKNPDLLGYRGAITVSHPIQAWYQTGITDIDGRTEADHEVSGTIEFTNGGGFASTAGSFGAPVYRGEATTRGLPTNRIEGWKGRPELTSDILGVIIIADVARTSSHKLGAIADYAALLALSQSPAYESCQAVASVANEMSPGCAAALKPDAISPSDIGFLRGIYRMDPGASLQVQQDQIAGEMQKSLGDQQ